MSFSRQLALVLFLFVLCALTARAVLTVQETQDYLSRQLESHARDAARTLGLSISLHLAEGDDLFMESVVDSLFDSGDYESIRVVDLDGSDRLSREREQQPPGVPDWFVRWVPIETPEASAVLTAGWNNAGHVSVRSYPGYAYQQLWESTARSALSALVFLVVALALIGALLRWMLRPLDLIERQALAVAERRFPRIERLPTTREFRRVAEAMNFMTGNVEKFIADQIEQARRIRAEAYLDPVTRLRNRRALHMDVDQLARAAPQEGPGALMLVKVRGLDAANRRDGYEGGDAFVGAVAERLSLLVDTQPCVLGRWGGAIFALVLPQASRQTVTALAETLVGELSAVEHRGVRVEGVNVGVVFHSGSDDAATLVEKCEAALSNAEGDGPGKWHLWQATETVRAPELRDEAHWQSLLKRVIEKRELVLQSQPVVGADGAVLHHEVLARFRNDDGSLVPAARFIPLAVRLGLSAALDVVIVEKALDVLAVRFQSEERLAVNLSAAAAADIDFVRWLAARLSREPRTRRSRVCVEISEHFAARNPQAMRSLVESLRPLEVSVGVDHCGADDVSLAALRGLPLDYAKVYGAFTTGIDEDRERQQLMHSLVSIGHGMGLAMVAEYVETEAERRAVSELGFDAMQGYLLGRPQTLE